MRVFEKVPLTECQCTAIQFYFILFHRYRAYISKVTVVKKGAILLENIRNKTLIFLQNVVRLPAHRGDHYQRETHPGSSGVLLVYNLRNPPKSELIQA
jgi:hypothetical protein